MSMFFKSIFAKIYEVRNRNFKGILLYILFMSAVVLWVYGFTGGDVVTSGFVVLLCLLLAYDLLFHTYSKAWYPTMGMFGTFLGIFIGLMEFDTVNIENSLPVLLNGLKIAFLTSIAGLVFSMLRIVLAKLNVCPIDEKTELAELENMNSNFDKFLKKIGKNFGEQIQEGLSEALSNLTENISNSFTKSIDKFTESVNSLSENIIQLQEFHDKYDERLATLTDAADNLSLLLDKSHLAVSEMEKSIEDLLAFSRETQKIIRPLEEMPETLQKTQELALAAIHNINTMKEEYAQATTEFFSKINTQYENELTQAGGWIAGIVEKLADDFEKVNKELESVAKTLPNSMEELKKYVDKSIAKNNK